MGKLKFGFTSVAKSWQTGPGHHHPVYYTVLYSVQGLEGETVAAKCVAKDVGEKQLRAEEKLNKICSKIKS